MRASFLSSAVLCLSCGGTPGPTASAPPAVPDSKYAARGLRCEAHDAVLPQPAPLLPTTAAPSPSSSGAPSPSVMPSPSESASAPKKTKVVSIGERGWDIRGPLGPGAILSTTRHNFRKLRVCYEAALKRDPATTGVIATELVIGRDGRTEWADSRSEGTTITDQEMISCVEGVFACLAYPPPQPSTPNASQPGKVFVRYPLRFATERDPPN